MDTGVVKKQFRDPSIHRIPTLGPKVYKTTYMGLFEISRACFGLQQAFRGADFKHACQERADLVRQVPQGRAAA